jgi:hypothetical protein
MLTIRGRSAAAAALIALVAGCSSAPPRVEPRSPAETHAEIVRRMPVSASDRDAWASDIVAAFASLDVAPTSSNLCATLAIIGQESNFVADPAVPGLGRVARAEIDRRAHEHDIPSFVVSAALALHSSDGRSYADRIAAVRTERELSLVYEDLIGRVPLGKRLFADSNPVHTGGPMQVSVSFAEDFSRAHDYPYGGDASIRHEVFSRRGGVYFGVAHLLAYRAPYDRMIYRFADYNAGFYASRNAAFQHAVTVATGIPLALDGDLVAYEGNKPGATELAVRTMARTLDLDEGDIHRALAKGESADFAETDLYERVYARAQRVSHAKLPRARVPEIALKSPKITRKLTTAWFAERVDSRYQACMAKGGAR